MTVARWLATLTFDSKRYIWPNGNIIPFLQFFTYNKRSKGCGLRNFVPQSRAFSLGNISGLKSESPMKWTGISNSVYVANSVKTKTATDCQSICLADEDCKAMIFNGLLGQCSLNYGEGPYREIPLGNQSKFGISSCIKNNTKPGIKFKLSFTMTSMKKPAYLKYSSCKY